MNRWRTPDATTTTTSATRSGCSKLSGLCDAHLLALRALEKGASRIRYNLGNGAGYSNMEVITTAERVTGKPIKHSVGPRRPGDPPRPVADATLAKMELGWAPRFDVLDTIIEHARRWEQKFFGSSGEV